MALDEDGRRVCLVEELQFFLDAGRAFDKWGNETRHLWWHLHKDGSFTVDEEPDDDPREWPVPLMNWPGRGWIEQWEGDLGRAVRLQVQPVIDRVGEYFKGASDARE